MVRLKVKAVVDSALVRSEGGFLRISPNRVSTSRASQAAFFSIPLHFQHNVHEPLVESRTDGSDAVEMSRELHSAQSSLMSIELLPPLGSHEFNPVARPP